MRPDYGGGMTILASGTQPGRRVHKLYVDVLARTNVSGDILPIRVIWPDGRAFTIDEILDARPFGPTVQGVSTAVYTCRFGGHRADLYLERAAKEAHLRWWVWAFDNDPALGV